MLFSQHEYDYEKGLLIAPPTGEHKQADEVYIPWEYADILSVDPLSRQSARTFYFLAYMASEDVPCPEDASVSQCDIGTSSFLYDAAALLRVNYFRKMSGLREVFLSEKHGEKCRAAALMMVANCAGEHHPPASWLCFNVDGSSAAAHSNLFLHFTGASAVTGYIFDFGPANKPVGHRRGLLRPKLRWVGTGSVIDRQAPCIWKSANAFWTIDDGTIPAPGDKELVDWETMPHGRRFLWIYDEAKFLAILPALALSCIQRLSGGHGLDETDPWDSSSHTFVCWPPEGYVPADLAFPRWSLSYPSADFGRASVVMTGDSGPIPLQIVHYDSAGHVAYGDTAIVWEPVLPEMGLNDGDASYQVEVSNIQTSKGTISHSYTVTLMSVGPDPYADSDDPELVWVYPSRGSLTQNTRVAVFGRNLGAAGATVTIGGLDAVPLEMTPNAVLVEVAPQLEGAYDVVFSHPGGRRAVLNSAFSYSSLEAPVQGIACCGQTTRIASGQGGLSAIKSFMGDWLVIALACLVLAQHKARAHQSGQRHHNSK